MPKKESVWPGCEHTYTVMILDRINPDGNVVQNLVRVTDFAMENAGTLRRLIYIKLKRAADIPLDNH
jgi:hypothetical protein